MRCYECECENCRQRSQLVFHEPYPEYGDIFLHLCRHCGAETHFTRTLTKKTAAELRRIQAEADLKQSMIDYCAQYGFRCRFLFESVIITTPLADWSFGYHERLKTLRHESTIKINFQTGDYAKTHEQFANRKMTCFEVIDYIAAHDQWRQKQKGKSNDPPHHP